MNCDALRKRLTAATPNVANREISDHLNGCADCARFAARLRTAHEILHGHQTSVVPDPSFVIRVRTRLERNNNLSWAVARLLPASLALLAVLAWFSFQTSPTAIDTTSEDTSSDLLTWVLESDGLDP